MLKRIVIAAMIIGALLLLPKLIVHMVGEHKAVLEKSKMITISYYFPHFPYFASIATGDQAPQTDLLEGYHDGKAYIFLTYYTEAAKLFADKDAAHALLGFTHYYRGNLSAAENDYEKSLQLNPYFFWSYYNLAVIYFQQEQWQKSAVLLERALMLNPQMTLAIINQDAFYRQIWRNIPNAQQVLTQNVSQGMQDAALMLAVCVKAAQAGSSGLDDKIKKKFQVRLF